VNYLTNALSEVQGLQPDARVLTWLDQVEDRTDRSAS